MPNATCGKEESPVLTVPLFPQTSIRILLRTSTLDDFLADSLQFSSWRLPHGLDVNGVVLEGTPDKSGDSINTRGGKNMTESRKIECRSCKMVIE